SRRSTWPPPCSEAARNFFAKKCLTIRRRRSIILTALAPVAQLDRVSDYESEGREFESLPAHQAPHRGRDASVHFCLYRFFQSAQTAATIVARAVTAVNPI